MFYIQLFYFKNERIPHSLFFGERCEGIAQVTHQKWAMWANRSGCSPKKSNHERFTQVAQTKWAIVSELFRLLTKNERMSESLSFLVNCSFAHFWAKNKQFARKTDEQIPSPDIFMFSFIKNQQIFKKSQRPWKLIFFF